jgi:sulfite exporter TauE/SafE
MMCGGIGLSQCMRAPQPPGGVGALKPSALYNLGRVISYRWWVRWWARRDL